MSLGSQSDKPLPKRPLVSIRLELKANRAEFHQLSAKFNTLEDVNFKGHLAYPELAYALPPYEIYFQLIFTVSSMATIADIIYKFIKRKNKEVDEIKFIFNGKEMVIKGDYSLEELEVIVKEFSKIATTSELKLLSNDRQEQLIKELETIKKHLPTYKKLVEIGNERLAKGEKINLEQHQHYIKELNDMETRKHIIEDLLKIT